MSDAKHTAGPWKAYGLAIYTEAKRAHWVSGRDARQSLVANVRDNDDGDPENVADNPPFMAEAESNAHLIAAAPELLEALEAVFDRLSDHYSGPFGTQTDVFALDSARAAIAKAKGQA